MGGDDWGPAPGGVHALGWGKGRLAGHALVVHRRLLHVERVLRAGYVEAVAVRAGRRGRGYGGAMVDVLERVIRRRYDVGPGSRRGGFATLPARGWNR